MTKITRLGRRVKARRDQLGLSQRAVAERGGFPASVLAELESGASRNLSTDTLPKLARGLAWSIAELLGEAAPHPSQPAQSQPGQSWPAPPEAAGGVSAIVIDVRHDQIRPSPLNPRAAIDPLAVAELAANIRSNGLLQNLVVRANPQGAALYEISSGARRWAAIGALIADGSWPPDRPIQVTVRDLTDIELIKIALSENIHRRDMHPLDEGQAFATILDAAEPGTAAAATLARELGVTERYVQLRAQLNRELCGEAKLAWRGGQFNLEAARALLLGETRHQRQFLREAAGQPITAAWIRTVLAQKLVPVMRAIFPLDVYTGEIRGAAPLEETGDEIDDRYFADPAQFRELQEAAISDLLRRLQAKWSWARVERGHIFLGDFERLTEAQIAQPSARHAARAGAIVEVNPNLLTVRVIEGLVAVGERERPKATEAAKNRPKSAAPAAPPEAARRPASTTTETADPGQAPALQATAGKAARKASSQPYSRDHLIRARQHKTAALQKGLLNAPLATALRLVCLGLLGCDGLIRIGPTPMLDGERRLAPGVADRLRRFAKPLGAVFVNPEIDRTDRPLNVMTGDDADPDEATEAATWLALTALSAAEVEDLFRALVAGRLVAVGPIAVPPLDASPLAASGDAPIVPAYTGSIGLDQARGWDGATPFDLDAGWLAGYRGPGLRAAAIAAHAMSAEDADAMLRRSAAKLREAILASPSRRRDWIPPELLFGVQVAPARDHQEAKPPEGARGDAPSAEAAA